MKKIRVFGLILAVMALIAFLVSCSNPAGPRGDRLSLTENTVVRGGVTIVYCAVLGEPTVTSRPDGVTYGVHTEPGFDWVIILRPAEKIAKDKINVDIDLVDSWISRETSADGDFYRVVIIRLPPVITDVYLGLEKDAWGNIIIRNGLEVVTVVRAPAGLTATITDPSGDAVVIPFEIWRPVWEITLSPPHLVGGINRNSLPVNYIVYDKVSIGGGYRILVRPW